jgi:eukaryotic-like serine/threonine-protein kinase
MTPRPLINLDRATWPTLSKLLDEWLDLELESRPSWLESLSPEYDHVLPMLRELIAAQTATAETFLNTLPPICNTDEPTSASFATGTVIGAYRLIRELGHGGMSVVWLAEPADGALKRPVALKLPMVSIHAGISERFQRERDILAQLTHPHIARLYDAGMAAGAQPYLAMEYVDGEPITTYCDRERLALKPRLRLFLEVLSTVQYAHANLVVHRDLKPSNILVTRQGDVRLLDFGIAKLLTDGEASESELTRIGGRALTPDYASPEQITGAPATTATDIYSLGVVLYELLTGEKPYRLKHVWRGGLEQAIMAADPVRPSQVARNPERAYSRATTPKRLARSLKSELDTIVSKTLQKEPRHRYATADAFAQDIERFLRGEAVLAKSETPWYRTLKFVGRHKLGVSATVAVIAALSVGLGVALWQARIARMQTKSAQAAQSFLEDIFRANSSQNPDPMKARQTTARQLLDLGAKRLDLALQDVPTVRISLMGTIAEMYADLGLKEETYKVLRARVDLAKAVYGPHHPQTGAALVDLAQNIIESSHGSERAAVIDEASQILDRNRDYTSPTRGRLYFATANEYMSRDEARALDSAQRAVTLLRRVPPSEDLVGALRAEGLIHLFREEFPEGIACLSEAVAAARSLHEKAQSSLPPLYARLADARYMTLDWSGAEENCRLALKTARSLFGEEYQDVIQIEFRLGYFLVRAAKPMEGFQFLRNAVDLAIRTKGLDNVTYTGVILAAYGDALRIYGNPEEGLSQIERAVDVTRRGKRTEEQSFAQRLDLQALCEIELGHIADAGRLVEESDAIYKKTGGLYSGFTLQSFVPRANLLNARGRAEEAKQMLKQFASWAGDRAKVSSTRLSFKLTQAETELALGSYDEAIRDAEEVRRVVENNPSRGYMKRLESVAALTQGKGLVHSSRPDEALPLLERSVALGAEVYDPERSLALADAQLAFGECLARLGNTGRARALLARAKRIHAAHKTIGEQFVLPLRRLEVRLR